MPVDPRTGQPLPYPGEPGYDESMAANPDVYADAGAMPPDAGMMPPEAGGLPPEEGAMLPEEGAPSPDDVVAAEDDELRAQQEMMAATAPAPEKPFTVKAINTLFDEFNSTIDAFAGDDIPDLEWMAPEGESKWDNPLPPEIYVPLVALDESLKMVSGGEFYDKYAIAPDALTSDPELRKATANLKKMGKDKGLIEAMQAPISPEGMPVEEGGMPPEPGMFDEEEQTLAANMA